MPKSAQLYERSSKVTPKGVSSPVRAFLPNPIFAKSGKGCIITDADGRDYIDFCMAYGPLILGHSNPDVMSAVIEQLTRGTVYGMPSEQELLLLESISSRIPCAESIRLTNSGTEATMHAIRLARGYTGKNGIVKIDGGFHGSHDALMVNGIEPMPFSEGIPRESISNTFVIDYNNEQMLNDLLEKNNDIAALILEPILGNVGIIPPKKGYLEEIRRITSENDVLLIFDEVITGARVSSGGAQSLYDVKPDLCTMGKIIGGGFPIGAVAGSKTIIENFAPQGRVYEAGTFSGNPVTAVAGCKTLECLTEDRYRKMSEQTDAIVKSMSDHLADVGTEGCVQSAPSMFQIFFGKETVENGREAKSADMEMFGRLFRFMLNNGVYLPPSGMEVEFISAAHDDDSIDRFTDLFGDFLREMKK